MRRGRLDFAELAEKLMWYGGKKKWKLQKFGSGRKIGRRKSGGGPSSLVHGMDAYWTERKKQVEEKKEAGMSFCPGDEVN